MSGPRIPPLGPEEWGDEPGDILGAPLPGSDAPLGSQNIFGTLARNPELFRSWLPFGGRLLVGGALPARNRELMILRTSVRCRCSYEASMSASRSRLGSSERRSSASSHLVAFALNALGVELDEGLEPLPG